MIKNIIYVEDGSVDVDELREVLGSDTHIIIYRQGAPKPEVLTLSEPMLTAQDEKENTFKNSDFCTTLTLTHNEVKDLAIEPFLNTNNKKVIFNSILKIGKCGKAEKVI